MQTSHVSIPALVSDRHASKRAREDCVSCNTCLTEADDFLDGVTDHIEECINTDMFQTLVQDTLDLKRSLEPELGPESFEALVNIVQSVSNMEQFFHHQLDLAAKNITLIRAQAKSVRHVNKMHPRA